MSETRRLSEAGSARVRALLRAGAEEAPSDQSVRAAARVLGLVPRAALVAYALVTLAKSVKWSSLAAYVLAPAIVVAGAATALHGVAYHGLPAALTPRSTPAWHPATVSTPQLPPPVPELVQAPVADTPGPEIAAMRPRPTAAATPGASRITGGGAGARDVSRALQEQVAILDRARAAASAGDFAAANEALDGYDRRFPRGPLSEEALLLRIEANLARGDRATVAALAHRFLTEHPRSVHAERVRSLIGTASD